MICSNCGSFNTEGTNFCVECGQSITPIQNNNNLQQTTVETTNVTTPIQTQVNYTNTIQNAGIGVNQIPNPEVKNSNVSLSFSEYFFIILAVILKPFTSLKEELGKFDNFKNSFIMSIIISAIATLVKLVTTMYSTVRVKNYNWSSGDNESTWVWENLKELDYLQLIGKTFLIFLGVILVIAAVYYIASLIIKKQPNFSKLLCISTVSLVPMLMCYLVISPLLSLIWLELAVPTIIIGAIYTIVLLYEGMNNEVGVEGNEKYYFNLVCLSLLAIAGYYFYSRLIIGNVTSELEDLTNFFK